MGNFPMSLDLYMSSPVHTVRADQTLEAAHARMAEHSISSLAVVDGGGKLAGVVSRTDLLRIGRRDAGAAHDAALLTFPSNPVSQSMTAKAVTLGPKASVAQAAKLMTEERLHRIYVVDGADLLGVVSTKDVMKAVRDTRVRVAISEHMSSPVFTVRAEDPVSLATERLEKARVSGLVVVDGEWPVGVFTQEEALEWKDIERDVAVEAVMSPAMICLDVSTPIHRAAAHAVSMDVRRIIAVENRQLQGILTGLDIARVAA